jgi:class 3 adenylate cyclase
MTDLSSGIRCPRCRFDNRVEARFCGGCGDPLATEEGARSKRAERRQLTVMFCDLVDSTPLAGRIDPEDFRELVQEYQLACDRVIRRLDGWIGHYLGDGIVVYFGFPHTHEDMGLRAVRAGLGILDAMDELNERLEPKLGVRLQVRIGAHTGLAVVGEMGGPGRLEDMALGEAPNVAARVQGVAEPDTVAISGDTLRLVRGHVDVEALGPQTLKGVNRPIDVFRVVGVKDAARRFEATTWRGLTPLVGRETEVATLLRCLDAVREGAGRVVHVVGEAGMGKSRLSEVLRERAGAAGATWWTAQCSPLDRSTALSPVIGLLNREWGLGRVDSDAEKLGKIESALTPTGLVLDDVVPLMALLLSVDPTPPYGVPQVAPMLLRARTLAAVASVLAHQGGTDPLILEFEDLHWVDATSLELVQSLVASPPAGVLTILTSRPGFEVPWSDDTIDAVRLGPLDRDQVAAIVHHLAGDRPVSQAVTDQILERTDGVPLFVEELTRAALESEALEAGEAEAEGDLLATAIPLTLKDSLMARLDRMAGAKEVAQHAAVLGREFDRHLLQAVLEQDEAEVEAQVGRLVDAHVLMSGTSGDDASLMFSHALVMDAAYDSQRGPRAHRQCAGGPVHRGLRGAPRARGPPPYPVLTTGRRDPVLAAGRSEGAPEVGEHRS